MVMACGMVAVGLVGCMTLKQSDRTQLQQSGVSTALQDKMINFKALTAADIVELTAKKVPDQLILDYMKSTRTVYLLQTQDVLTLHQAGVSDQVINFLLLTQTRYAPATFAPLWYPYDLYPPIIAPVHRGHHH